MEDGDAKYNVVERILDGTEEPTDLPFQILESITENFSEERKIGVGGFGEVFKGVLQNGSVAVKRIHVNSVTVDDRKFLREVTNLFNINHPNVVRFLGFCSESRHQVIKGIGPHNYLLPQARERLLCFEYISNASLDKHITDELRGMEWNTRFQIIKGICQGLQYLHEDKNIIHMDLKPENIMVDDDMVPKITDFGLARLAENSHTTGPRFFTRGYCAPEYEKDGDMTFKCDMYSLGATIIELVTGRKGVPDKTNVLRRWKWSYKWNISARQVPLQAKQVTKCIQIAERCMRKEPARRPSISKIMGELNEIENTSGDIMDGQIRPSDDDMLGIEPLELRFAFEPNKQIPSGVQVKLTNETGNCVAFNIECHLRYSTQPKKGIVPRFDNRAVNITLQAHGTTTLPSLPLADTITVQSTIVEEGLADEKVTEHMFIHEAGKVVDEVDLTVVYDMPEEPQAEPNDVQMSKDDNIAASNSKDRRLNFHPPQITLLPNLRTYAYRQDNPAAVDVVTGAMGPLLPKLRELLKPKHKLLQTWEKKDMESLERQLKRMQPALWKVSQKQLDKLDPEKCWADEVRELSYDVEDLVDGLLLCTDCSELTTYKQDGFQGLQETIQDIKKQVNDLVADRRYPHTAGDSNVTKVSDSDPRLRDGYIHHHKELVGIDSIRNDLVKRLNMSTKQPLKIISIFGHGGLGKTTLARAVYDRFAANGSILKAFVTVGRNPDIKAVLADIIYQLDKKKHADIRQNWDQKKNMLTQELRDHVLKKKRYIVVIDDIWDIPSWDIIKPAFIVDNNPGSIIITTSRNFQVAKNCGEVCELKPLSHYHSKELFNARLPWNVEYTCTSDQPEDQCSHEILEKCRGVPLAIIAIASVLADKPKEHWPEVYKSIGFGDEGNEDVDNTKKILLFSYHDLPSHLKTCLLHLSTFPEDREVEKNTLVWRWVAEGFVHAVPGKTLFMVGETYFNELVNRSLLQPVEGTTYTIHVCRVHDMVLDMICSVAKDYNFVSTILDSDEQDSSSYESSARRLSVRKKSVKQDDLDNTSREKVRSFSATAGCHLFDLMSSLPSFEALRVLSIDHCELAGDNPPENLAGLHHLRYLGLSGTNIGELPMELGKLRFLLTLDLRGTAVKALPQSVTLLIRLKCLRSEGSKMRLPDGMGNLTCLEELRLDDVADSPNFVKELGNLTELRMLRIGTFMFRDSLNKALVESLSRLKKIEELELCDGGRCTAPNWDGFSPSERLHHLRLHNIRHSHGLPAWINPKRLPSLSHLNVYVKSAGAQDLDILGSFPKLGSLCLFIARKRIIFPDAIAAGAFPKLQYYYMSSPLKCLPGAMPCLQSIEFHVDVKAYRDANIKINLDSLVCLPLLVRVHANIIRWKVTVQEAEDAEKAVRSAVENKKHPNCPILVLDHIGSCTDEFEFNSSHANFENAFMSKLESRISPFLAEESDSEQIDPMDEEVMSRDYNFKLKLPSIIESIVDEMLHEGGQREAEESDSEQIDSTDIESYSSSPNIETIWAKALLLLTKTMDKGGQGEAKASNSVQIDSTDEELLPQQLQFPADTPTVVHQQHYRFPAVKPIVER